MKQLSDKQIIVGPARLSYLTVFAPRMNDQKEPPRKEYSATILIPKVANEFQANPNGELTGIAKAVKAVLLDKFKTEPPVWSNPLKDGDKELNRNTGKPKYPGYWFMTATAKEEYAPKLVDGLLRDVTSGWNSGDWGKIKLNLFAFDQKGNRGVSCGLNAIQFTHKDESLGGGESTADGFDADTSLASEEPSDPFASE